MHKQGSSSSEAEERLQLALAAAPAAKAALVGRRLLIRAARKIIPVTNLCTAPAPNRLSLAKISGVQGVTTGLMRTLAHRCCTGRRTAR